MLTPIEKQTNLSSTGIDPLQKQRGQEKLARIPVKIEAAPVLKKPDWIRIRLPTGDQVDKVKAMLRQNRLHTVCEEAACPNLSECFSHGTATFMIMGDKCTRRCTFCDVGHGRPDPLDLEEPLNLAKTVQQMGLKYVVITSVDRDDLRDGGAQHFANCIQAVREYCPTTKIEILVPDFRGKNRRQIAIDILTLTPPDVFNHNIETIPSLYPSVRPGSDYQWSLNLLKEFKAAMPHIPTKSGIMLGLGETNEEILQSMRDLRAHDVDMVTIGQYLQPSLHHHPVLRYVTPAEFDSFAEEGHQMGFTNVASGPLVRSSYHADRQAQGVAVA
ncbi:MAG TPA: lipoyl synthase [Gammaproteobacteria bacterium]|nr:lipoyl synthase [Gammaproteobacteria bacterium]